jgi:hypothetical protein
VLFDQQKAAIALHDGGDGDGGFPNAGHVAGAGKWRPRRRCDNAKF